MTVELVFDQSQSQITRYNNDLKILLDLAARSESVIKRQWSETTTAERESNLQYSVGKRQKEFIRVSGKFYFNGTDKSQGTLQKALNTGDLGVGTFNDDDRLVNLFIDSVDTGADSFTVSGDRRRRVDLDSTIVVLNSTGNDDVYNPTGVSFDPASNSTTISVSENVSDSTADGFISTGIFTVNEQLAWLEDFIDQNIGAPQHVLKAPRYDSERNQFSAVKGKQCVVEEVATPKTAGFTTAKYNLTLRAGRPV